MSVTVKKHDGARAPVELGKRTYLPFTISCPCAACGGVRVLDLSSDYLSYPVLDAWRGQGLDCPDCGANINIDIRVSINVEARQQEVRDE